MFPQLDSVTQLQQALDELDTCFLKGFVGTTAPALLKLPLLFSSTPLQERLQTSITAIQQNTFDEAHFVSLAAARHALQGTLYDVLRTQALASLARPVTPTADDFYPPARTEPLLASVRHWLMDIVLMGFARLEMNLLMPFATTLTQLRSDPATAPQAALLTGFWAELVKALPIKDADTVPLTRWCDLWSQAMLDAVGIAPQPQAQWVSGTLYPLGIELRHHAQTASIVIYSVLTGDSEPRFVRQTWSAFKSTAIQGNNIWLLFPDAQVLLQHLLQSKTLLLHDMPLLPTGDLVWQADAATTGKAFKPLEIALQYCGIGQPLDYPSAAPLARHPIQLAEPLALTHYQVEQNQLWLTDGTTIALSTRQPSMAADTVANTSAVFGLLRYDAGCWELQVLLAGDATKGKGEWLEQAGLETVKKPPKTSTVAILQERASRLLRKVKSHDAH